MDEQNIGNTPSPTPDNNDNSLIGYYSLFLAVFVLLPASLYTMDKLFRLYERRCRNNNPNPETHNTQEGRGDRLEEVVVEGKESGKREVSPLLDNTKPEKSCCFLPYVPSQSL